MIGSRRERKLTNNKWEEYSEKIGWLRIQRVGVGSSQGFRRVRQGDRKRTHRVRDEKAGDGKT